MDKNQQGSAPKKPMPVYMVRLNVGGKVHVMVGPAENQSQALRKAVEPIADVKTLTPWEVASWNVVPDAPMT